MSRGVCVIGVGGSGQNVLIFLKERLIETYGKVPDSVVLLSLDTSAPEANMSLGGINLNLKGIHRANTLQSGLSTERQPDLLVEEFLWREREELERNRAPEFHPLITDKGKNVDNVIQEVVTGHAPHFQDWIEVEALTGLPPAQKAIAAGAGQRRPLGRIALFLDYPGVYAEVERAFRLLFANRPIQGDRHNVFVVGSVAGGTGSGVMLDVLNIVAKIISDVPNYQLSTLTAFVVLPSAFQNTATLDARDNLQPNSYAALRELDRFQHVHSNTRPTLVRYGSDLKYLQWVTRQLASYVYLVDTTVPGAGGQITSDPRQSVFPAIADFIAAKVTAAQAQRDGTAGGGGHTIESLENNFDVTLNQKWLGRQYLGLNTFTYIVPINDIVRSLSFRYLHEMYERLYGDPGSQAQAASVKQTAAERVEEFLINVKVGALNRNNAFEETSVPTLMRAAVLATRAKDPQSSGADWESLLRSLARTPEEYEDERRAFQEALDHIEGELVNTIQYSRREGDKESFEEGAERLIRLTGRLMDKFLGPQIDPKDPQSRVRGEWNQRLKKYDTLQEMFASALDFAMRGELNRRDEAGKLFPNRLAATWAILENVRDRLKTLAKQMDAKLVESNAPQRYANLITQEIKAKQAEMEDTKNSTFIPMLAEKPLRAQKDYIDTINEYLRLELSLRIFERVKRTLALFGVEDAYEWIDDEGRAHKEPSVIARGLTSLDNWNKTLKEADITLAEVRRRHDLSRQEKTRIKVRQYLTDAEFESKVYEQCLSSLDRQIQGKGDDNATPQMHWAPKRLPDEKDDEPSLILELGLAWGQRGEGPVDLAIAWMGGARRAINPVVSTGVSVVNRLYQLSDNRSHPESLATQLNQMVDRPLLRHNADNAATYRVMTYLARGREDPLRFIANMANVWSGLDDKRKLDNRSQPDTDERAASLTTISFTGAVAMAEVEQFRSSEAAYRSKIAQNEPVHVFAEEQHAVKMEQATPSVFERQATQRTLSPEVVICMTDKRKLEIFAAACAYGVIQLESADPNAAAPYSEAFARLPTDTGYKRLQLGHNRLIEGIAPGTQPDEGRIFLDALQQFCIVETERIGLSDNTVMSMTNEIEGTLLRDEGLAKRPAEKINPFRLRLSEVERAVTQKRKDLGPSFNEEPDPKKREQKNARRCLEQVVAFKHEKVDHWMDSLDAKVQDLGIVMALLLNEIDQALRTQSGE